VRVIKAAAVVMTSVMMTSVTMAVDCRVGVGTGITACMTGRPSTACCPAAGGSSIAAGAARSTCSGGTGFSAGPA
jgi:hypothetical protein